MRDAHRPSSRTLSTVALILAPLVLLAAMVAIFLMRGDRITAGIRAAQEGLPIPESVAFERVVFKKSQIVAYVRNAGRGPITISGIHVNDMAIRGYLSPSNVIPRLGTAVVTIPFSWVPGEPYEIRLVSSTGLFHSTQIDVATLSPTPGPTYFAIFALLGVYVGVIPVFLGLTWFPVMKRLGDSWISFLMAFTVGLLIFLGVDAISEALDLQARVAGPLQPVMLILIATVGTFLLISWVGQRMSQGAPATQEGAGARAVSTLIAFGIGVHNFGEGLAIGAAYALGQAALGGLLVLGFMIHNTTEGIAIVAPLTKSRVSLVRLALLGALAGIPTIFGAWVGGFAYSPMWSIIFLSIGAGAIFQVIQVIVAGEEGGPVKFLSRPGSAAGLLAGLALMYVTGLMVS